LEQTVTKLQTALGFTPEQVAALPPPLVKIKELEAENLKLRKENDDIRRMFQDPENRGHRNVLPTIQDPRTCDRDVKRRKMANGDDVYMASIFLNGHSMLCYKIRSKTSIEYGCIGIGW
jgi:hypothetical protein